GRRQVRHLDTLITGACATTALLPAPHGRYRHHGRHFDTLSAGVVAAATLLPLSRNRCDLDALCPRRVTATALAPDAGRQVNHSHSPSMTARTNRTESPAGSAADRT